MPSVLRHAGWLLGALALVGGCGIKGPPRPPSAKPTPVAAEPAPVVSGPAPLLPGAESPLQRPDGAAPDGGVSVLP